MCGVRRALAKGGCFPVGKSAELGRVCEIHHALDAFVVRCSGWCVSSVYGPEKVAVCFHVDVTGCTAYYWFFIQCGGCVCVFHLWCGGHSEIMGRTPSIRTYTRATMHRMHLFWVKEKK